MAVNQDKITKLSKQISDLVIKVQAEFISDLLKLKEFSDSDDFIQFLQGLDVERIIEEKAKTISSLYFQGQQDLLLGKPQIARIAEQTLNSLTVLNQSTLMQKLKTIGPEIRNQMVNGLIGGLSEQQIVANVSANSGLLPHQSEAFVNTALNNYSRSVTAKMAEELPSNTKFNYIGPIDSKTRDICLRMADSGSLTRSQIASRFPGSWIDGGGVNCRHQWEQDIASGDLHRQKEATRAIQKKQKAGKWKEPQTFAQSKEEII